MATSLYDLTVVSYLQTVRAVAGVLEKGAQHCRDADVDPDDFVGLQLFADMAPFHFQIRSVAHHSVGALEGVKSGLFHPPAAVGPVPYADLMAMMAKTEEVLTALTPDEVNGWEGKDVSFQIGERKVPFTAEGFILSFSLPNFYFHATTAYDLLRTRGVALGKRNYLGQMRVKAA